MGLLDALFSPDTYGSGGGILDLIRQTSTQPQVQPSQGFPDPPASFASRFNALPNAPPVFTPSGRNFDPTSFDPSNYAPNQAQPIGVGGYQMPRIGSADQFTPDPAAIPPAAQAAQGNGSPTPPSAPAAAAANPQQTLPTFMGGPQPTSGFGDRLNAGLQNFANAGGPLQALAGGLSGLVSGNRTDPLGMQQQNLKAQYDALVPTLGPQKAMLAVMNPEAAKTLISEALTNKEKWGEIGSDSFGNKQMGWINERDQTINGKEMGAQGAETGSTMGFLAPGVKQVDSTLQGADYLKQFSPEVQAAVQNYIDGKSTPTGNPRKGFTQTVKMIAQKVGADTGQSVDDATYAARRTMRNQLSSSAPSSLGGQINIGNTAAGHLADLSQRALDLGNYDTGIAPLSGIVNSVRGLGTEQAAKMEALKGAAQHYGQEITKFYAGSPGGTAERDRFIESVNGARSPKELAAILATEGELMRSRLDALGGQIKGVLGEEGAKQYPVLRPDGQAALTKVEENVSKLKGGSSATPAPSGVPSGWSVKVR
jgi:hypothetical protein